MLVNNPTAQENSKPIRTSLDLSPRLRSTISNLQKETDVNSMVDVIRSSINLYDKLITASRRGEKIYIATSDGKMEQVIIV